MSSHGETGSPRESGDEFTSAHLESVAALSDEMYRLVRRIRRASEYIATDEVGTLERAAYVILAHLVTDGSQRITALAEAVHSDVSTLSRQAALLVDLGLVERHRDPEDGRAWLLSPSERGISVFRSNRRRRAAHFARVLRDWDDASIEMLESLLSQANTAFETYRTHHRD
ncbi:MarR family transcriptional regulator [Rhodococcus sp. HNM0569]|uniref:MarR family winged helix-turn-helix transcriptional regulator n=1 Tax=Rhodococcus sp. HNM0569 TaxID=2716340 RepID=UPI00197F078F|nr:MarR family transcriptional regulator [Rhodococcus sp. HNM0569]